MYDVCETGLQREREREKGRMEKEIAGEGIGGWSGKRNWCYEVYLTLC